MGKNITAFMGLSIRRERNIEGAAEAGAYSRVPMITPAIIAAPPIIW